MLSLGALAGHDVNITYTCCKQVAYGYLVKGEVFMHTGNKYNYYNTQKIKNVSNKNFNTIFFLLFKEVIYIINLYINGLKLILYMALMTWKLLLLFPLQFDTILFQKKNVISIYFHVAIAIHFLPSPHMFKF